MARILLIGSKIMERNSVAQLLRAHRHNVLTLEDDSTSLSAIGSRQSDIDVILIDIANINELLWRQLKHMCSVRRPGNVPALIMYSFESIA